MNGLLNNSSSVNSLPLPDIMEVDSLRGKCSGETTNQDGHCHALFPFSAWRWTTPKLKLEPQYQFNASTHSREAWKHGTRHKGTFQLCQSLVNVLYFSCFLSRPTFYWRWEQQHNHQTIWKTWCVWFPHCELSLYVNQYSIRTSLRCLCISAHSLCSLLFKS